MFNDICIYEAKLTKIDEIEELMKEVADFYLEQEGVMEVHYIKRTHRQKDFNAVKEGELPVRLTKNVGKVTYVLYWVLENEEAHARVSNQTGYLIAERPCSKSLLCPDCYHYFFE